MWYVAKGKILEKISLIMETSPKLQDYALIGNCRSAALVNKYGSIDCFVHGAFVLSVGLQLISVFHPRMALPYRGPTPTRQLEPPGFFALNYGKGTPIVTLLAHLVYGGVLGMFLSLK